MKDTKLPFWNHNAAYYKWIKNQLRNCQSILDVGCGDGTLALYLADEDKTIVGIDTDKDCIKRAKEKILTKSNVTFKESSLSDFKSDKKFDAITFVASIHHMKEEEAIKKAKELLKNKGILLIVGLYKPSTMLDYLVDIARFIPCQIGTFFHHNKTSEELNIPTNYQFSTLKAIRKLAQKHLPNAKIKYGLYNRYLLIWQKDEEKK